jgi:hypothetical protein
VPVSPWLPCQLRGLSQSTCLQCVLMCLQPRQPSAVNSMQPLRTGPVLLHMHVEPAAAAAAVLHVTWSLRTPGCCRSWSGCIQQQQQGRLRHRWLWQTGGNESTAHRYC